ncbi:hypothetical protein ACHWQZ_G001028 [Mnemiopsis leidyi]
MDAVGKVDVGGAGVGGLADAAADLIPWYMKCFIRMQSCCSCCPCCTPKPPVELPVEIPVEEGGLFSGLRSTLPF